jgi:hypothetical protein
MIREEEIGKRMNELAREYRETRDERVLSLHSEAFRKLL